MTTYRGFSTIAEQVTELRHFAANPQQRVRTGLDSIDLMCEGPAAGEVFMFMGRSYSGKSQVATNIMARNPSIPLVFFSLEMPARQVTQRLYSTVANIPHFDVLRQTKAGSLSHRLDEMADKQEMHVVVDKAGLTLGDMSAIVEQYEAYFQVRPAAVIIDYLELVQGGSGEGHFRTEMVAKALKNWAKDESMAVYVLHQTNRSESEWKPPTADSARGAGYTESDVVIGMWQPSRDPDLGELERKTLDRVIYMNVLKNRITGRTTNGHPIEYKLEPSLRLVDLSIQTVRKWWSE